MRKLYIVFDSIPSSSSGGLVTTYIQLSKLLSKDYDIHILATFNCKKENKYLFSDFTVHTLSNYKLNLQFLNIVSALKKLNIKLFFTYLYSLIFYFIYIPIAKYKTSRLIKKEDLVIASCPSAAIFISKNISFILEIHTKFDFFYNSSITGKMQTFLAPKAKLTLFRTKTDANIASQFMNASYIYNFFDENTLDTDLVQNRNSILYMGRLSPEKDPLRVVFIAKELVKINKNFKIDIYGTGILESELAALIQKEKLEKHIELKGFTKNKSIYKQYSLLLVTSKVEGLPLSIIEAKANKIPTISSKWGNAVTEVITDGVDGYILDNNVDIASRINNILTDDFLFNTLCYNAYLSFQPFSSDTAYQNWKNILENNN